MPERRTATPPPPALKRILLVDDEANMREALGQMLEQEGLEVIAAENGEAALRIVERQSFDAILCDIQMPKLDGWQFLDAIRELNETAVVIMMSGQGDRDSALQVMKRGAYDYIEHHRPLAEDARNLRHHPEDFGVQDDRPHHRRERHGQGADRPGENEIRRVGGDHPINVDVRVVARSLSSIQRDDRRRGSAGA